MSNRTGMLVGLLTLILFLRVVRGNKLGRAWKALWDKSFADAAAMPSSSAAGGLNTGGGQPMASVGAEGGLTPQAFLHENTPVRDVTAFGYSPLESYGTREYKELNFPVAYGTPVTLPSGEWRVDAPTWGGGKVEAFSPVGHSGILELLHLSANYVSGLVGKVLRGGTVVGRTGAPDINHQPGELGYGPHLAVVVDRGAAQYLGAA